MTMTPDEVIKILENMLTEIACKQAPKIERLETPIYDVDFKLQALQSAITLLQDYQKLRGLIDKAQVKLEQARILSVKEPMQLSDRINLNGIIREAQSYLQQPTEHIER